MSGQPSLFATESIPLAEQIEMVKHQLRTKCNDYNVTFGIFKNKNGREENISLIVFHDKKGVPYTIALNADDFFSLVCQVNEALKSINP